jgi:predicted MFS family arabinose efflux permease
VSAGAAGAAAGRTAGPASSGRMVAAAVLATTAGTLPTFLIGGLAVQVEQDVGIDAAQLGGLVTTFFALSAVSSTPAGHLTERLGTFRSILLAATCSGAALALVGALGTSFAVIAAGLALAGLGNSVAQPAANLLLARGIPPGHRGLAFGIKQASVPLASFLAGAAVPALGLTIGWRWAFLLGVLGPVVAVALTPRLDDAPKRRAAGVRTSSLRSLVALAVAAGAGTAAATTLGTFLVASAVDAGMAPARAGILLAVGSALGVAARVSAGWRADHREGGHLRSVRAMMLGGAVGFALLAVAEGELLLVLGTALGFAAGWGWNGLLVFAVVQHNLSAPAAATGVTQTGLYVGGMTGPLTFGLLSVRYGFAAGWWLGVALLLVAAVAATVGERWLRDVDAPTGSFS